ncbi:MULTISPECIES: HisA/HisF family protein [Methanobacterium]|uniref:Phosphoribosylformimino-5-aminoimidazole carboxamide ribotide isomerase n=1 Tax=Methanobacterium bryantii TaxID=2161 RepID=A0A2A2H286_METBR|nr:MULTISPECIES: HisA/HisF family protein [Methanobacterium]OEC87435.1 phosphoribosylformimino-5-aminoimidazole carboxamide ribotide isomerase [Methanobacterium sp. A39]PAV03406.1 phosphoribosylformimino-5-aminoimidazole carboxamide ribotide isomerase [Methanobacterium bryantii]
MIIPVLDLKNGIAVSGKSGKRETYKPLKTVFHESASPEEIAKSLRDAGAVRIYIADLDSIENRESNFDIARKVNKYIPVMLDCGAKNVSDVGKALEVADKVIIATETLENMDELNSIFDKFDKNRLIISIDIKDGKIFSKYLNIDINYFIRKIEELNPQEVILLDISQVGTEKGVNEELIKKFLKLPLIIGGGITSTDINKLEKLGINKFLVGSALHKGKLALKI